MEPSSKENKQPPPRLKGLSSAAWRVAVVASRFNGAVVDRLLEGALEVLVDSGSKREDIDVVRVPGAFELPLAASRLAGSGSYDAVVALGCVVRGETPHFEYVSLAAAQGLERVSLDSGIPIGFGLLTTDTMEQALARAGGGAGNRGSDAAAAAIEMVGVLRTVRSGNGV